MILRATGGGGNLTPPKLHVVGPAPTAEDIADWLARVQPADHAIEVRAPGCKIPKAGTVNVVKRFPPGAVDKAAAEAHRLSGNAPAVYLVMNGVDPALPTRGVIKKGATAENIPRRFRLLIDCDPVRPADTSATLAEVSTARALGDKIRSYLQDDRGWPAPLNAESGNGYHLVYAVDLPNDDDATELVKSVLAALAAKFDTPGAKVDRKVFDAPRLVKLYGTLAAKGERTPDRPHRYSRVCSLPGPLWPVTEGQLRELVADLAPPPEPEPAPEPTPTARDPWTVTATNGRPDGETRAAAYLAKCDPAVSGQGGHDAAFKAACKVGPGFDLPAEVAFRLLWNDYNPRCDPAWSEKDLRHKVDEAYKVETRRGWLRDAERPRNGASNGATNGKHEPPPKGETPPPDDGDQVEDHKVLDRWPRVDERAFHGIAGEVVDLIDPHTEADRVATLVQFLVAFANLIGRSAYFRVSATRHYLSLFCVLVGATAAGRKGTSWDGARWALELCDRPWGDNRIQSGLVSGEGLIHHVRDRETEVRQVNGKEVEVEVDPGVPDKRLLVVETELSRALKAMNREGNTLSDVLRQAWDNGNLRTLGKHKSSKATGAHISIIGHSTPSDVAKHLSENDSANGFANRFLWAVVRRSKELPTGGAFHTVDWSGVTRRIAEAVTHSRQVGEMTRDPVAGKIWAGVYSALSEGKPGLSARPGPRDADNRVGGRPPPPVTTLGPGVSPWMT